MKAVASITIDNEFVVHDIKIIDGDKGLFIAMPSKKTLDGEYRDIAHPINSETRDRIQRSVIQAYEATEETGTKVKQVSAIQHGTVWRFFSNPIYSHPYHTEVH